MTEQEWLTCSDPAVMVKFLRGKTSERKLRLFAVGCCQRIRHLLVPAACEALDVAEKVAEGSAGSDERRRVREMAFQVAWHSDPSTAHRRGPAKAAVCDALARRGREAAAGAAWRVTHIGTLESYRSSGGDWDAARKSQAAGLTELLRCVVGNPFQPVNIVPSWLTWNDGLVVKLAKSIYDDRAFDRLSVLAKALEEAGCGDAALLDHCRHPRAHVRGCWAVDALLGRS